jgi:AraC-like DNA-binding protein
MVEDWDAIKGHFMEEGFYGIDGRTQASIDAWCLTFPTLDAYRCQWLQEAAYVKRSIFNTDVRQAHYDATTLRDIEIEGDSALAHMKFDVWLTQTDGQRVNLQYQTLYVCRKKAGRWKIASFVGYLPIISLDAAGGKGGSREGWPAGIWQYVNSLADLSGLKALLSEIEQTRNRGMTADERLWLDRACALLTRTPSEREDYAGLAAQLGVSYEVFRHRFRRLTGMSPHRYRQSRVMDQACQLLCTTQRTISEIAANLGFCDEFHFSRSFKKITGQSPTMFRRKILARG